MKVTHNDITPEINAIIAKATELTEGTYLDPETLLKIAFIRLEKEGK